MKKVILIIDDSAPILFLLEALLGKKYAVVSATDGLSAMMWLSKGNHPDLIITDLQMPNIDGLELVKHLRSNELYDSIPVIILSGATITQENTDSIMNSVSHFVRKPFDPMNLLKIVDESMQPRIHHAIAN